MAQLVNDKIARYDRVVTEPESPPADGLGSSRPYHHGDLRNAIIGEAVASIAAQGVDAVTLRDLARRLGVSHAAPAYHFGDREGLLVAVAARGYDLLAERLSAAWDATDSFLEVGVAYVRFAIDQRPYFEVMFRPELRTAVDPALRAARARAGAALYGRVGSASASATDAETLSAGVAAWSLVHGLATLWLNRSLPGALGDDPDAITRAVARHLFGHREDAPDPVSATLTSDPARAKVPRDRRARLRRPDGADG